MKGSKEIANLLLQSKAIKLEPSNPFTWASGWKSPIYCDNRKTLSYPDIRTKIRDEFEGLIRKKYGNPAVIAGVATGAIAQAALVAEKMVLPMIYVRSSAKGHGMQNLIEGKVEPGKDVVVVEDLVSTGGSSLKAVDALREAGMNVLGMVAVFSYGFRIAEENFRQKGCNLFTLTDYEALIEVAGEMNFIKTEQGSVLREWRNDPANWGK